MEIPGGVYASLAVIIESGVMLISIGITPRPCAADEISMGCLWVFNGMEWDYNPLNGRYPLVNEQFANWKPIEMDGLPFLNIVICL